MICSEEPSCADKAGSTSTSKPHGAELRGRDRSTAVVQPSRDERREPLQRAEGVIFAITSVASVHAMIASAQNAATNGSGMRMKLPITP